MTGDIYNEEAGDKWTLDTGQTGHNTAQHTAQVLTNVYSEGDTLTLAPPQLIAQ